VRVTAVVVNWDNAEDLPACLDALLAQDHPDLEILVVDNASTDASHAVLASYGDRIAVRWNVTNRGYAGAMNDAIAMTESDAVLAVNPDVTAAPDLVRLLVAALDADPTRGSIQPRLHRSLEHPDGVAVIDSTGHQAFGPRMFRNRGEGDHDDGRWDTPDEVFGVCGACALYRREMLVDIAVGGEVYAEDLFAFFEDVDLDWRAQLRGWSSWYEPAAVGRHERGGAGPRRTDTVERLNFRNRLLVIAACDDLPSLVRASPSALVTTALKAASLAARSPRALVLALADLVTLAPSTMRRRAAIGARATVPRRSVVARWFEPFAYRGWVRGAIRRARGIPAGH